MEVNRAILSSIAATVASWPRVRNMPLLVLTLDGCRSPDTLSTTVERAMKGVARATRWSASAGVKKLCRTDARGAQARCSTQTAPSASEAWRVTAA